jgi:hypothetical protein
MSEWVKVVTNPLGLAGFALFLVFAFLAKVKGKNSPRWPALVAVTMAVVALVGGLALAYRQGSSPSPAQTQPGPPPAPAKQQTNQKIEQTTSGPGSPAVQGVQGDVNITVDQSSSSGKPQNPAPAKAPKNKPNQR